ncbi:MAG TPA: GNAT family N-acetyltransferase [Burkholderiaceae bacterium]|nr:GNAT family N-acetyltransferase [Burkholderiaceae bacterium]
MKNPVLLDLPAAIQSQRLLLRSPRSGDGAALHETIVESLPELRRFLASLPWVAEEQTRESAEVFCRNAESNFLTRRNLPFLMFAKESGCLIGVCGLHRTVWDVPKTEVGYWVRSSESGKGYVTEAVTRLVAFAFEALAAERIEIITDAENLASRRVAERCGFTLEGLLRRERRAPDGSLRNTCVYARLADR